MPSPQRAPDAKGAASPWAAGRASGRRSPVSADTSPGVGPVAGGGEGPTVVLLATQAPRAGGRPPEALPAWPTPSEARALGGAPGGRLSPPALAQGPSERPPVTGRTGLLPQTALG